MQVKNLAGEVVGETTSGTFSPTLQKGIALALLNSEVSVGDNLVIDVRGRDLEVVVARPPFVNATTK
jgi:aminomethyltransferase